MALALKTALLEGISPRTAKHDCQTPIAPSAINLQPLGSRSPVRFQPSRTDEPEAPGVQPATTCSASPKSYVETRSTQRKAHRVKLCYHDEAYRLRAEARTKGLLTAASSTCPSNSALLAKKALKYRKLYERMTAVDVNDPEFDVFEFLGVDWCKATSIKPQA